MHFLLVVLGVMRSLDITAPYCKRRDCYKFVIQRSSSEIFPNTYNNHETPPTNCESRCRNLIFAIFQNYSAAVIFASEIINAFDIVIIYEFPVTGLFNSNSTILN